MPRECSLMISMDQSGHPMQSDGKWPSAIIQDPPNVFAGSLPAGYVGKSMSMICLVLWTAFETFTTFLERAVSDKEGSPLVHPAISGVLSSVHGCWLKIKPKAQLCGWHIWGYCWIQSSSTPVCTEQGACWVSYRLRCSIWIVHAQWYTPRQAVCACLARAKPRACAPPHPICISEGIEEDVMVLFMFLENFLPLTFEKSPCPLFMVGFCFVLLISLFFFWPSSTQ